MKILPTWLREFVDIPVDDRKLADDLTNAGTAVEGVETEDGETVYEVEFTANRVDTMSHYGVARECSAIYDRELRLEAVLPHGRPAEAAGPTRFRIEIEAPDLCARYTARIVRNLTIGLSPGAVVRRLELCGSRSINNATDASNYTLLEMGHPTHCFDLDLLEGGKIVVRRARPGEKLKTLDGVERVLHPEDLVIADAVKPVALAGVMGGFNTMITGNTHNVLVEAAWFDPATIRRTARQHGMHTDASHRFERGADVGATPLACARVAGRLLEWAGGEASGGEIDAYPRRIERPAVQLRRTQVERVLGAPIAEQEIERILRRLGFGVTPGRASAAARVRESARTAGSGGTRAAIAEQVAEFVVQVPTWRLDVEREIDLIEEVARIYGYDRFPSTLPAFAGAVEELSDAPKDARLRTTLLALGHHEAVSLAFISREDAALFSGAQPVELANPVSEEEPVLRTSMLPGMLRMLAWNLNRENTDVRLFEAGHVFERMGDNTSEGRRLSLGATGAAVPAGVHEPGRAYSFFDLKGTIEELLRGFEHQSLYFDRLEAEYLHPGRAARAVMDGATVARFGQLHPRIAADRKLRQEVYLAEIDLERLYRHELRQPKYREVPRYPAVERDFSFIFGEEVTWGRIQSAVEALRIAELRSLAPVEIFRGGNIPAGKYSILLRAVFQSGERTLRDDEVALWASQIVEALKALGGMQRL